MRRTRSRSPFQGERKDEQDNHESEDYEPVELDNQTKVFELTNELLNVFCNAFDVDGWIASAESVPEMHTALVHVKRWVCARDALRTVQTQPDLRNFELAVVALTSFICKSESDSDTDSEFELSDTCYDEQNEPTKTDETNKTDEMDEEQTGELDDYLRLLGVCESVRVVKLNKALECARIQCPKPPLSVVCTFLLMNKRCTCLPSMSKELVDAAVHSVTVIGSDACAAINATLSFYTIEHSWPTLSQFGEYCYKQHTQTTDPVRFYKEEEFAVRTPNLRNLKPSQTLEDVDCLLCGQVVCANHQAFFLSCGHVFHGDAFECLDGSGILTWLETNKRCPTCRSEVIIL